MWLDTKLHVHHLITVVSIIGRTITTGERIVELLRSCLSDWYIYDVKIVERCYKRLFFFDDENIAQWMPVPLLRDVDFIRYSSLQSLWILLDYLTLHMAIWLLYLSISPYNWDFIFLLLCIYEMYKNGQLWTQKSFLKM